MDWGTPTGYKVTKRERKTLRARGRNRVLSKHRTDKAAIRAARSERARRRREVGHRGFDLDIKIRETRSDGTTTVEFIREEAI